MPKTTEDAYDYIQDEEDDDNQEESQVVFMPDANTEQTMVIHDNDISTTSVR